AEAARGLEAPRRALGRADREHAGGDGSTHARGHRALARGDSRRGGEGRMTVAFSETLRAMARYNRWMNERLYECCAGLSDAERKADRKAFFGSIHGTLNHLLLGDRLWLGRFLARPYRIGSLADELYADFAELRRERAKTDAEILEWVETLD